MKWLWYSLTFAAGAIVGGLLVREIAIRKVTGPVDDLSDRVFGENSYASGQTKTAVNAFLRSN